MLMTMPRAINRTIEIEYEAFGSRDDPVLMCVPGLGSQLLSFPTELCEAFVDRGFFVIRMDNRDAGLSSMTTDDAPYTLNEMADDVVAVLDHAGVSQAMILGVSMGGMIAQVTAIRHPHRTNGLVSIMSTTGESDVGGPTLEAWDALVAPPEESIEAQIEADLRACKIWSNPEWFDPETFRANAASTYQRAWNPGAAQRQIRAIMSSESRVGALGEIRVPTLVIHGALDTLIDQSGGARTAELIPGARYLLLEDMSHDFVPQAWPPIIEAVTALAAS
ncbi:MAG: alpha/beta fold hydrolase [Acidimicrobiia bacterium]|nr:alpha/beta fold hydrolase [Acidimicrobiia bacterium]